MIAAINPLSVGAETSHLQTASSNVIQPAATSFADMMVELANGTINKIEQAEQVSIAKMSGAEMPLREIVDKVMAAQQALNTTLAIRDKIVQAYIEISHMQI